MPQDQYVTLSEDDHQEIALLLAEYADDSAEAVEHIQYLFNSDLALFFRLVINSDDLLKICREDNELQSYWKQQWALLGQNAPGSVNFDSTKPPHINLPEPTLNTFDQLIGRSYQAQYESLAATEPQRAVEYLRIATKFGSHFALALLLEKYCEIFKANPSWKIFLILQAYGKKAAKCHLTPGYILLARTYTTLAAIVTEKAGLEKFRDPLLRLAHRATMHAKQAEPASTNMIHNYYFLDLQPTQSLPDKYYNYNKEKPVKPKVKTKEDIKRDMKCVLSELLVKFRFKSKGISPIGGLISGENVNWRRPPR